MKYIGDMYTYMTRASPAGNSVFERERGREREQKGEKEREAKSTKIVRVGVMAMLLNWREFPREEGTGTRAGLKSVGIIATALKRI